MPRNILNSNYNLRDPNSIIETPINLILRYNNQKLIYSTAERINPKFWQNKKSKKSYQRAIQTSSYPEYPEFNARLNNIETGVRDVFRRYQNDNDNQIPTTKKFKNLLDLEFKRKQEMSRNLVDYINCFIAQSTARVYSKRKFKLRHYRNF